MESLKNIDQDQLQVKLNNLMLTIFCMKKVKIHPDNGMYEKHGTAFKSNS